MNGTVVVAAAAGFIAAVLLPGIWLVWPRRRDPSCRTDLGVALLTGALVAFTVLAVQIVFDIRFAALDRQRQEAQNARDELLSMKIAISSQRDLTGIQLQGLDLAGFYLARTTLSYARMHDARLVDAVLGGADLTYADLTSADLTDALANTADLRWATLTKATLKGIDLSGAKLQGADLTGAVVAREFARESLSGTEYDASTKWPNGVRIPPCKQPLCVTD